MVEVGGRAGGAPPSAAGLRVNRGADTTTAQAWPSTSTYRVGDQLISAPERFLGSVTEGQIDTLPTATGSGRRHWLLADRGGASRHRRPSDRDAWNQLLEVLPHVGITGDLLTSRSGGQKDTPPAQMRGLIRRAGGGGAAGYFAAFFLRAAQEAFIRSDTASFSLAVIGRRFLAGVASDAVSATGVAATAGRREEERRAAGFAGAEVPRSLSTSFNALISACRRSIVAAYPNVDLLIPSGPRRSTRCSRRAWTPATSDGSGSSPSRPPPASDNLRRGRTWLSRGRTARLPRRSSQLRTC